MIDTAIGIHYNGHNFIVKATEKVSVLYLQRAGKGGSLVVHDAREGHPQTTALSEIKRVQSN